MTVTLTTTDDLYAHPEAWFPTNVTKQNLLTDFAGTAELGVYTKIGQQVFVVVTYIVGPNTFTQSKSHQKNKSFRLLTHLSALCNSKEGVLYNISSKRK